MGNDDADWGSDLLYGSEPSAAPATETLVADDAEKRSAPVRGGCRARFGRCVGSTATSRRMLTPAPRRRRSCLAGHCCARSWSLWRRSSRSATPRPGRRGPAIAVSAAPVPTPTALPADQDQAIPYTASANCPPGSTSAQALTDTTIDSAWVCVRGAQGATVDGQVLRVEFNGSYVVSAITATPGWVAKTPGGKDEWLQHRVVTRLQYVFNDTDHTIVTQDTANTHGPVTTALPHKVLASKVTVVVLQTSRPPASPLPTTGPDALGLNGFGDSMLGTDGAPLQPDSTSSTASLSPGDEVSDPVDATFAMSQLTFLGHEPN